ncbi:MAG: hypothetical protein AAF182_03170 [Pseudomonadota bacterium]
MQYDLSLEFLNAVKDVLDSGETPVRNPRKYAGADIEQLRMVAMQYNIILNKVFIKKGKIEGKSWQQMNDEGQMIERGFPDIDFSDPAAQTPEMLGILLNDAVSVLDAADMHQFLYADLEDNDEEIKALEVSNEFEQHLQSGLGLWQIDGPQLD